MKIYALLFVMLFPCVSQSSDSQNCSSSIPYIGISSTSACISAYSLLQFMMPDAEAKAAEPYTYRIGKGLLLCAAATSAVSSAFALQEFVDVTHADSAIDSKYIDAAGAAIPVGYVLSIVGGYMVNHAALAARDGRVRAKTEESILTRLLPKSWSNRDKQSLNQDENAV